MTEIQDAASWPAYSDGSATTGTPVNAALLDAIAAAINELCHAPTNPGVTPASVVAEIVLARGGAANLAARLDAITDDAERASAITCERCGEPGVPQRTRYWAKTLCAVCGDILGYRPATQHDI